MSLTHTRAIGVPGPVAFNDAFTIGGHPRNLIIEAITSIEVFATANNNDSFIDGLIITYTLTGGIAHPVTHGIVTGASLGILNIPANHHVTGCYGRLKVVGGNNAGLLHSIGFVVLNSINGTIGPHWLREANAGGAGSRWGAFGRIVAFQGTTANPGGTLSSLGFVKASGQPNPETDLV